MNTKNMTQEHISALIDNELADAHVEVVLATLHKTDGREAWDLYHQIGDAMRSDEMTHAFSPDFAARMRARLDAEPAIVAPMPKPLQAEQALLAAAGGAARRHGASFRRFAVPGAAAAVAIVALIGAPQWRQATKGGASSDTVSTMAAVSPARSSSTYATLASASVQGMDANATAPDGVILRDPRIDEYLLAHQRFSPSLYSTAQYARAASFISGSDK